MTDALAEYWHKQMRKELGIAVDEPENIHGYVTQQYQGSRYGFGYPSCPDLSAHEIVFELIKPEKIGISLTENYEMVPEQSTSALVAHHPQAKYFCGIMCTKGAGRLFDEIYMCKLRIYL